MIPLTQHPPPPSSPDCPPSSGAYGNRPLAIAIDLATCYAARDASDKQRRRALALHCGIQRYEAVAAGGPGYALDGTYAAT
jgi:hypothetical protein